MIMMLIRINYIDDDDDGRDDVYDGRDEGGDEVRPGVWLRRLHNLLQVVITSFTSWFLYNYVRLGYVYWL